MFAETVRTEYVCVTDQIKKSGTPALIFCHSLLLYLHWQVTCVVPPQKSNYVWATATMNMLHGDNEWLVVFLMMVESESNRNENTLQTFCSLQSSLSITVNEKQTSPFQVNKLFSNETRWNGRCISSSEIQSSEFISNVTSMMAGIYANICARHLSGLQTYRCKTCFAKRGRREWG